MPLVSLLEGDADEPWSLRRLRRLVAYVWIVEIVLVLLGGVVLENMYLFKGKSPVDYERWSRIPCEQRCYGWHDQTLNLL